MRGLPSTLALLAVLVGLGVYIYFTRDEGTAVSTENRVFAALEADQIQSITVRSESGDATTLERSGDEWQIVSPIAAPAAAAEVAGLTSTLTTLDRIRVVDDAPADLAEFGLEPPRVSVDFQTSGDAPSGGLLIGNKTSTGENLYAKRIDDDDVFLIPAYQESSLNRSTYDLRDKSVVRIDRDRVRAIDVRREGSLLTVRRQDDAWRMTAPVEGRADLGMVEGLIGAVANAQMRSVISESPTPQELRAWGLEGSPLSVVLMQDGEETALVLGNAVDDAAIYAKEASSDVVVTVDRSVIEVAGRPAEDYRRRDIFGFRAYTVSRIELARGDDTFAFERVRGEGATPDSWRRVSPTQADVERSAMDLLLTGLADMRVTSFVPSTVNTGLDAPVLRVTATFEDDDRTETVRFGRQGANAYAARTDEPGALQIDTQKLDDALEALDGLAQ